ncbi:hypothetical protein [Cryobacterium cryoconiti]|uniref:Uncharacterized protein n=1 Tax=Cryobacterium cryoconiti TaxID=1259239 RepID=A0A4Y8JTV1_9MICO|nr:hypothetical protein [Cryobacterium cryoconiti]TFD29704.1 hypothetical protein E3T49_09870 [Cryobacterium cryoconiti]
MNKHQINPATATSRTKRVALGAASVLTAGALLGVGAQGATAAPLSSETTSSSSSSAGGSSTTTTDAFLASITTELRADLSHGQSWNVKAQNVATTVSEHAELFESLPANLQDDLTTLTDASGAAERAAAVDTVRTTALAGGYGEEITTIAEAVRDNPQHPLAAAVRAALGSDVGTATGAEPEAATDTGFSVTELALHLADNAALLEKLPADLQDDLADLKSVPADEQEAAAQALEAAALNGDYGTEIQKLAERVQTHVAAEADADANVGGDADAGAGAGADADVHAGN